MHRLATTTALLAAMSTSAFAKDKPLPDGIAIISEAKASSCTFVDIVSAMRFAMTSASKTQRGALVAALEKAKLAGANSAVVSSMTVDHNQHQVTLKTYRCP